jgi:hypothetical protein
MKRTKKFTLEYRGKTYVVEAETLESAGEMLKRSVEFKATKQAEEARKEVKRG